MAFIKKWLAQGNWSDFHEEVFAASLTMTGLGGSLFVESVTKSYMFAYQTKKKPQNKQTNKQKTKTKTKKTQTKTKQTKITAKNPYHRAVSPVNVDAILLNKVFPS